MPQYDLKCDSCGHEFVSDHGMSEPHPKCPECDKPEVSVRFTKPPAYHARYSPLHPRKNRGRGY